MGTKDIIIAIDRVNYVTARQSKTPTFVTKMGTSKTRHRKRRKIIAGFLIVIAVLLLLVAVAVPPVAKRLIERHDVEYTGREITLGGILLNPLTGALSLRNMSIFEQGSDTLFMKVKKFKVNVSLLRLLTGTYDISSVRINQPEIRIVRDDSLFNFTDLIERFEVAEDTVPEEELKLNVRNISLKNGSVFYSEKKMPVELNITGINFTSDGMYWDRDTINGSYSLVPGSGLVEGDFMFNIDSLDYRMSIGIIDMDLGILEHYLDEMTGGANFSALLNMNARSTGNFNEPLNGMASGRIDVRDVHFGKNPENDYFSLDRFLVSFSEVNMSENRFAFDSILIDKPEVLYQVYDTLDNFRRMFITALSEDVEEEVEEELDTIPFIVDLQNAKYSIESFALNDGRIEFNDYSLAEKFSIVITPFNIKADSIDSDNRRVNVKFDGKMIPSGNFAATLSMNPEDQSTFSFDYEFRDIPATMFNPYIVTHTSYQLDRGTVEMHGTWNVKNTKIDALNHFLVLDPSDTKRVRDKDSKWIPMPLILAITRERGGAIDYQIPVSGDLASPSFNPWDVISDILRNILVKPPTTPYRLEVRNVEKTIDKNLMVKWNMRRAKVEDGQDRFMEGVAEFLEDNPEAGIVVQPIMHEAKEKESLLVFEAKKKYFMNREKIEGNQLPSRDSMEVEEINTKDKDFMAHLNRVIEGAEMMTLQEKCARYVGTDLVDKLYNDLLRQRRQAFMSFFREEGVEKRVSILDEKNEIPYNWFSYYKITYKGEVPEELKEAFDRLYELNSEPPRRRFFQFGRR